MVRVDGRVRGSGTVNICLALLAVMAVALIVLTPSHAQLEVASDTSGAQAANPAGSLLMRKRLSLRKEQRGLVGGYGYTPPVAVLDRAETISADRTHVTDPAAYVPPADANEDGGLFDMSTP
jgi:hypothetical protein